MALFPLLGSWPRRQRCLPSSPAQAPTDRPSSPMTLDGERIRFLHVSQPTAAGVAVAVYNLVRYQQRVGLDVHLACPGDGWLGDRAAAIGAEVHGWPSSRNPGPSLLAEMRSLRRVIDKVDPDLLHLHSSKAGLAGRLAVRGSRPTVFHPNAWSFLVPGPTKSLSRAWEQWAARWTNLWLMASESEACQGREIGIRGELVIVPNGVDLDRFDYADESERGRARAALGLGSEPIGVCVGRLCEQKGQDILISLWTRVRQEVPDAVLLLVGDGPDRERHRFLASEGVRFVGEQLDVRTWLAAADVAVQPSRWEGMSFATLETMAVGRSVVTFDVSGMGEAIGAAGAVVDPSRPDLLVKELTSRLSDLALCREEGLLGRRRAEEQFSAERYARLATDATLAFVRRHEERVPYA
jgi:glycosyltransferase involved in cell wall biosynthesis